MASGNPNLAMSITKRKNGDRCFLGSRERRVVGMRVLNYWFLTVCCVPWLGRAAKIRRFPGQAKQHKRVYDASADNVASSATPSGVLRGASQDTNALLQKLQTIAASSVSGDLYDWWALQWNGSKLGTQSPVDNRGSLLMQRVDVFSNGNHSEKPNVRRFHRANSNLPERRHKVEHLDILNNEKFWWLTGALLVFVAMTVVTIEVKEKKQPPSCPPEASAEPPRNTSDEDRNTTILQLVFCIVGLNISMLMWGITQEYVMTNVYTETSVADGFAPRGEKLPSSLFLVLCNRLGSIGFSMMLSAMIGQSLYYGTVASFVTASVPALTNLVASWSQYSSMAYISFPLQTTAKSAKMLPVLLLSSLRGRRQTMLDYAEAIVITSAVVVFGLEDSQDTSMELRGYGASLLAAMMFFDSITPHLQDFLFERYPDMIVIQANFAMSCLAAVVCTVLLIIDGQLVNSFAFLCRYHTAILHVAVLSLCSTLSQFLITYTIKRFGPVVFIIIVTTRQVVSVCLSAMLFNHEVTSLAMVAAVIVFGTVMVRALWRLPGSRAVPRMDTSRSNVGSEVVLESLTMMLPQSLQLAVKDWSHGQRLLLCAFAMHVPLCFWAVAQEFMATHTFKGQLFTWTLLLISFNRAGGVCFALSVIWLRKLPLFMPSMKLTALPATTNFVATTFQYQALYYISFPQQTLMKSLKVIPVMLCGRIMNNRRYYFLEYVEATMLTGIVSFFVWHFGMNTDNYYGGDAAMSTGVFVGVMLMLGYLTIDAFTSNIEDVLFQCSDLDPAHMMLGAELASVVVACGVLLLSGQFIPGMKFLMQNTDAILHLGIQVFASASGTYACLVTVRLFGPAVFTLLMMSRQVISLVISVKLFQHEVDLVSCLCLIVVAMLIVTSTLRKASDLEQTSKNAVEGRPKAVISGSRDRT
eukprot:TRINITY_DN14046_c0_g1_i1.p1 TRINITY_DN14046_c0_g1~~TRINITY_DN14046_c0_g1_i1.p1  ORF type:complete len:921 (-),score=147.63 TRINITY_DN14046_c0_g1_i1:38-2800(-)